MSLVYSMITSIAVRAVRRSCQSVEASRFCASWSTRSVSDLEGKDAARTDSSWNLQPIASRIISLHWQGASSSALPSSSAPSLRVAKTTVKRASFRSESSRSCQCRSSTLVRKELQAVRSREGSFVLPKIYGEGREGKIRRC